MTLYRFLTILITLIWSANGLTQPISDDLATIAKRGQTALKKEQYDVALKNFSIGLERAQKTGDSDWTTRFVFYQGNAYLTEASADSPVGQKSKTALAKQAVRRYQRVVELRPESGSAMVNLARSFTLLNDDKSTNKWYRNAIKLNDKKQLTFRRQYASYLKERNPAAAAKQLRRVIKAEPNSASTHRMLMSIYQNPKFARNLFSYLRHQVSIGKVRRAENSVMGVLIDDRWPEQDKEELMVVLAESLARQQFNPEHFVYKSKTAQRLKEIAQTQTTPSSKLRTCINELIGTIQDPLIWTERYQWWQTTDLRRTAIGDLIRSRARYYELSKRSAAETGRLYQAAIEINKAEDPKAIRDLVTYYSKHGDLEKINEISKTYEKQLFIGKGSAYDSGDEKAIYEYHRTLASIYTFQANKSGDWGSPSKANSAAFQLEHAYRTANLSDAIIPDTSLVSDLAKSYEAIGRNNRANGIRLEAAEKYTVTGDTMAADKVLQSVKIEQLSPLEKTRYDRIKVMAPVIKIEPLDGGNLQSPSNDNQ